MPRDPRVVKLQQLRTERLTRASGAYYGTRTTASATMPKGPRRRNGGRTALSMLLFVAILAIALYAGSQYLLNGYHSMGTNQAAQSNGGPVTVVVPEGETLSDLSTLLQGKGVISGPVFYWYMRFSNTQYKAGTYTFSPGMSIQEVGQALAAGPPTAQTVILRIKEGWRAEQVAQALADAHVASYQDVMREVTRGVFNYPFLASRQIGVPLEGYLFPDTYLFVKNSGARAALNIMLRNFGQKVSPQLIAAGKQTYGSFFNALIVASMIQRETGTNHDAYLIASVINNRLHDTTNQYPTLGIDATLQYAVGRPSDWWPQLTNVDPHQVDSPFNTASKAPHQRVGLPPWPISEPSLNSIEAAVNPASTNYFSYHHTDGSHGMSIFCTFDQGSVCDGTPQ